MRNYITLLLISFIVSFISESLTNPVTAFVVINDRKVASCVQRESIPSAITFFGKSSIDVLNRQNNKNAFQQQQQQQYLRNRIQLQGGLFGLGLPELALIVIGIGVVLGPEGIAKTVKSATTRTVEIAEEMKTIPEEFQKGVELGEIESRSRKAKRIVVTKGSSEKEQQSTTTTTNE